RTLRLVLLEHDRVEGASALVEGIEAFAEADDVCVRLEPECESHPMRRRAVGQPADAALDKPLGRDLERAARLRRPRRCRRAMPARERAVICGKAVAEPFARVESL